MNQAINYNLTATQSSWPSKAVCAILEITYRQLDLWIRSGLMTPSVAQAQGYGTARRFSFEDLVYVELIRQLVTAYVPLQSIKKALQHLQEHQLTLDELEEIYLVTDGADYFVLYYSDRELDASLKEAMQRGRPIISIALRQVVLSVQGKLGLKQR